MTLPADLAQWLKSKDVVDFVEGTSPAPAGSASRAYLLTAANLDELDFLDNDYNPREPNPKKVNELRASIAQLGLLTPLTCAYLRASERDPESESEEFVVLVDGRHRYEALKSLSREREVFGWPENAKVDLKIYTDLSRSDLYLFATYLNRTRRNLRKGEYYQVIVDIYETRERELTEELGHPVTEVEVFDTVSTKAVPNKAFDLSVGRLVGLAAFDEEDRKGWYGLVGLSQKYRFHGREDYAPLTAGNLGVFLGWLCRPGPYPDTGQRRAVELTNVIRLGRLFREQVLLDKVTDYQTATATTVASKHWVLDAFGKILRDSKLFTEPTASAGKIAPLGVARQDWDGIRRTLSAYRRLMTEQAEVVNELKPQKIPPEDYLSKAWTYQTQTRQIEARLRPRLDELVPHMGFRGSDV